MELTFRIDKECKGTRRYKADDPKTPIRTIYVQREYANGLDKIILSIPDREDV